MKTFLKAFTVLSVVYFFSIVQVQVLPQRDLELSNSVLYADPDDEKKEPPVIPPILHGPIPQDSIIYQPDGSFIIIYQ
jgi:hypothetical protein